MLLNNAALGFPRVIREMIGGAPLSSRWYAPTWSVAGGVLLNTPTLGAELFPDPGLEGGYTAGLNDSLSILSGAPTVSQSADVHGGSKAQQAICSAGAIHVGHTRTLTLGAWYVSSIWVKRVGGGMQRSLFYDGTNYSLSIVFSGDYSNYVVTQRATNTSGSNRFIQTFDATAVTLTLDDVSLREMVMSSAFATINARQSNVNLIAPLISTFTTGTQAGIVLRLDSPSNPTNFVIAYCDGAGNVKIEKCVNGTYTTLSTVAAAYGATKYFSAKANGSSISIYYGTTNFGTLIATVTVSDATVVNNTRHGLFSTYSGNQFAGVFSVVPYA
jgi:hypothetical protein